MDLHLRIVGLYAEFLIIGIGILLLLHNFDWFPWWRIQQFWPVLLIVLGVLMFRNRLGGR